MNGYNRKQNSVSETHAMFILHMEYIDEFLLQYLLSQSFSICHKQDIRVVKLYYDSVSSCLPSSLSIYIHAIERYIRY